MSRIAFAAACVALGLGGMGCGSSTPLTVRQFVRQANEVCYQANTQRMTSSLTGAQWVIAKFVESEQAKLVGVSKLDPPSQLRTKFEHYKAAVAARLARFKQLRDTGSENLPAAAPADNARLQQREDLAAAALQLRICREDIRHHDHRTETR
jgi:hypothetical protein